MTLKKIVGLDTIKHADPSYDRRTYTSPVGPSYNNTFNLMDQSYAGYPYTQITLHDIDKPGNFFKYKTLKVFAVSGTAVSAERTVFFYGIIEANGRNYTFSQNFCPEPFVQTIAGKRNYQHIFEHENGFDPDSHPNQTGASIFADVRTILEEIEKRRQYPVSTEMATTHSNIIALKSDMADALTIAEGLGWAAQR